MFLLPFFFLIIRIFYNSGIFCQHAFISHCIETLELSFSWQTEWRPWSLRHLNQVWKNTLKGTKFIVSFSFIEHCSLIFSQSSIKSTVTIKLLHARICHKSSLFDLKLSLLGYWFNPSVSINKPQRLLWRGQQVCAPPVDAKAASDLNGIHLSHWNIYRCSRPRGEWIVCLKLV